MKITPTNDTLDQPVPTSTGSLTDSETSKAFDPYSEEVLAKLEALGLSLSKKRQDAINGRTNSGIETEWAEDEEYYQGIDAANRNEATLSQGVARLGGSVIETSKPANVRSTIFLNITRPYVDAAAAKVADMLLPTDDKNFGIKPSPVPSLVKAKDDQTPIAAQDGTLMQKIETDPVSGQQKTSPYTVADHAKTLIAQANSQALRAETRIEDWLSECQYSAEVRKVIEDCARLGTGILKGPTPVRRTNQAITRSGATVDVVIEDKINPQSKRVAPENLYPDPACGENIHNGSYIWEKDSFTAAQLKDLIGTPGFIESQILMVLEEGPSKKYVGSKDKVSEKDRFEIWYFYGNLDKEDLTSIGCECESEKDAPDVLVVMVNDRVIKAASNPLNSGEFPYDVMVWQRRTDYWAGMGVGRQCRTPQRMLNASTRNLMDNAGLSAGPQIILRRKVITPADGIWTITPRKIWYATEEGGEMPVEDLFKAINIPSLQEELMKIIQFAIKMAEDVTGLPMLLQGQQGGAPDTVGGMQILTNNASSVLRRIARTFDDSLTEPHIRRYYEWLLLYGEDEEEKGDFVIEARGSSALVERDIQNQWLLQAAALVADPRYKIDPAKYFTELARSQKFDPARLQYTDEEWASIEKQLQAQAANSPETIRANTSIQTAQVKAKAEVDKAAVQKEADETEMAVRLKLAKQDLEYKLEGLKLEREVAMLRLAAEQKISLDKIRAQLTDTAIKEKNKRELFAAEAALKQNQGSGI